MLHYLKQQNNINNTRSSTDLSVKLNCTHLRLKINNESRKLESNDLIISQNNLYAKRTMFLLIRYKFIQNEHSRDSFL